MIKGVMLEDEKVPVSQLQPMPQGKAGRTRALQPTAAGPGVFNVDVKFDGQICIGSQAQRLWLSLTLAITIAGHCGGKIVNVAYSGL